MEQDMAFFGGKVPSTVTRKKMDDNDKKDGWQRQRRWMVTTEKMDCENREDGTKHGIVWGKSAINGDKKED